MPAQTLTRAAKRFAVTVTAVAATLGFCATSADATVYSSCTMSRCADARSADSTWDSLGYPGSRGWYDWPDGDCNYAGGTYSNREGELPAGHPYQEFDVYPRACGASRDAYRIVVDMSTGAVWFSPDHYGNFYRL